MHRRTTGRRVAAVTAVLAALWVLAVAGAAALADFPRGLLFLLCALVVAAAVWEGVLRRGWARAGALAVAVLAVAGAVRAVSDDAYWRWLLLLAGGALVWHVAARIAFDTRVALPPAPRLRRPVLLVNPRSGDGRAGRVGLVEQARARGIEPVELDGGRSLEELAREAVAGGADALAMAGGDGSQAVVAAVAAEAGLPFACIPSGTRNHFALDLGVDRDDVVGALDALVDGGERVVDLGEVNGRVFVNNVSLGVYAEAVQQAGYRQAKLRTLLTTVATTLGPQSPAPPLRWTTPGGRTKQGAAVVLVGNDQYRLGGAAGAGTRPALDRGLLGITVVDPLSSVSPGPGGALPWRQFTVGEFRVDSTGPVPAGVDGEATVLAPPVLFRSRPGALHVRIAAAHPGASPSAVEPVGALPAVRALVAIAAGRPVTPAPGTGRASRRPDRVGRGT